MNHESKRNVRVCEVQRERYTVLGEEGELFAKLKGTFYKEDWDYPVVGDYVTIKYNPYGDSIIEEIQKRTSVFTRPDVSGHAQGYV